MKYLTIIRHAKSSWSNPDLQDFDRPLNKRGKQDAPLMGGILAEKKIRPDRIVSSPAMRAALTAKEIAMEVGFDASAIDFNPDIYGAAPEELLEIIRNLDDEDGHVFLFGHNPAMHRFVEALTGEEIEKFVTCAVARIEFPFERWQDVEPGGGILIEYLYPKMFRER